MTSRHGLTRRDFLKMTGTGLAVRRYLVKGLTLGAVTGE
ncbi:MAG TPA: twin-arginine translocation signal domain-containing protein [Rubrobacter sp.]|jgi:hypothetical protein|nr:twin-arginine translocation signal domain-containing protein [Rubrobacter sp.]MDQ3638437.1 twin-arginine translocation signal domain-containing protein [Actinomycetota bacterium]HEV8044827.1 twin-arginine translocation signal domain-containing protein [Rubrobacter sp.]